MPSLGELKVKISSEGGDDASESIKESAKEGPEEGGEGLLSGLMSDGMGEATPGGGDGISSILGSMSATMMGILTGIGAMLGVLLTMEPVQKMMSAFMKIIQGFFVPFISMAMKLMAPVLQLLARFLPKWMKFANENPLAALGGLIGAILGGGALVSVIGSAISSALGSISLSSVLGSVSVGALLNPVSAAAIITAVSLGALLYGISQIKKRVPTVPAEPSMAGRRTGSPFSMRETINPDVSNGGMKSILNDIRNNTSGTPVKIQQNASLEDLIDTEIKDENTLTRG